MQKSFGVSHKNNNKKTFRINFWLSGFEKQEASQKTRAKANEGKKMANNKNGKKNESGNFSDFKMETTQLDGVVDASKLTMQD